MGRFGESQDKLDSSQKGELIKTRVGKNLVTKRFLWLLDLYGCLKEI